MLKDASQDEQVVSRCIEREGMRFVSFGFFIVAASSVFSLLNLMVVVLQDVWSIYATRQSSRRRARLARNGQIAQAEQQQSEDG